MCLYNSSLPLGSLLFFLWALWNQTKVLDLLFWRDLCGLKSTLLLHLRNVHAASYWGPWTESRPSVCSDKLLQSPFIWEHLKYFFTTKGGCRKEVMPISTLGHCLKEQTMGSLMPSVCERRQKLGLLIIFLKDSPRDAGARPIHPLLSILVWVSLVTSEGWGAMTVLWHRQEWLQGIFTAQQELIWLTWDQEVWVGCWGGPQNFILFHTCIDRNTCAS